MIIPVELVDIVSNLSTDATMRLFSHDKKVEETYFDEKGQLNLSNEFDSFLRLIYGLALSNDSVGRELKYIAARALFISGYIDPLLEISEDSFEPVVQAYRGVALILKNNSDKGYSLLEKALKESRNDVKDEILGLKAFIFSRNPLLREKHGTLFEQKDIDFDLYEEARGCYYIYNTEYEKAFSIFKKLLEKANGKNNRFYQMLAKNGLGRIYLEKKKYTKAKEFLEQALITNKIINAKLGSSIINYNLGKLYFQIGHYEDAFEHFRKSYGIRKLLDMNWPLTFPQYKLGLLSLMLGNREFGVTFLENVRKLSSEMNEEEYHYKLSNILSKILIDNKEYLKAYRLLNNTLESIDDPLDHERKEASLLLGILLALMGKAAESREFIQQSVEYARTEKEIIECIFVLSQLEYIAHSSDTEKAQVLFLRALRRSEKYNEDIKRAEILLYRVIMGLEDGINSAKLKVSEKDLDLMILDLKRTRKIAYDKRIYLAGILCEHALSYLLPKKHEIDLSIKGMDIAEQIARKTNLNSVEITVNNRLNVLNQLKEELSNYSMRKVTLNLSKCLEYVRKIRLIMYLYDQIEIQGF